MPMIHTSIRKHPRDIANLCNPHMRIRSKLRPHCPNKWTLHSRLAYFRFMKHHKEVDALIAQAEAAGICIYGRTKSHCSALIRRAKELELKRVFPNMYVMWHAHSISSIQTGFSPESPQRHCMVSSTHGIFMPAPLPSPPRRKAPTRTMPISNVYSYHIVHRNMSMESL